MKKRFIGILFVISILFGYAGTLPANAAIIDIGYNKEGDYSYYLSADGEITIGAANKDITVAEIPETIKGYPVTDLFFGAFQNCHNLTKVTIPSTMKRITTNAFYGCDNLKNVVIRGDLISIEDYAFAHCENLSDITIVGKVSNFGESVFFHCSSLTNIDFLNGATNISEYMFASCDGLTDLTIPNSITTIDMCAFQNCNNLTSVSIPSGVYSIGAGAFYGEKFTDINIHSNNKHFSSADGVMFDKNQTTLLIYPGGRNSERYEIPYGTTVIGDYAFYGASNLKYIIFPMGITSVGVRAFSGCKSLMYGELPFEVSSIGEGAFYECHNLISVHIPEGVKCIEKQTFYRCTGLTEVTIPDGLERIDEFAFEGCAYLLDITIPISVTDIEIGAFKECHRLKNVYYGGGEFDWQRISVGRINEYLTRATIHFEIYSSMYFPVSDAAIEVNHNPEYIPKNINEVTINGKGTAYGRFKIYNTDGTVAMNKKVGYTVNGGTRKFTSTNKYGYAIVEIPNVTQSGIYTVSFSGYGIRKTEGTVNVTVKPLSFKKEYELSIEKGASVGIGLGVGAEFGPLKAKAGVASAELDGAINNTFSLEQEFADNKNKLSLSSKTSLSAAVEAKVGLFAEATADDSAIEVSLAEVNGNAGYGAFYGVGFVDDDFNINDKGDVYDLSAFLISAVVGSNTGNALTSYIAEALYAPVNSYETGSVITLGAGASVGTVEVGSDSLSTGVTLAGIGADAVFTNSTKYLNYWETTKYSSGITASYGTKLFDAKINFSDASTSLGEKTDFIKDNMTISAERDEAGELTEVSISAEDSIDESVFLYNKTETNSKQITLKNENAVEVANSSDELKLFVNGNKAYFDKIQLKNVLEAMTNSDGATYSQSKKITDGLSFDLSGKVKILLEIGGKIEISGQASYEYEEETGIYENGTAYIQAKNDIGDDVEKKTITFEDIAETTASYIEDILSPFLNIFEGAADKFIEFGQVTAKYIGDKVDNVKNWTIKITSPSRNMRSKAILALDSEEALFSTSSLAKTIGEPYVINIEDEKGEEVTEFSENPIEIALFYTEEQLADANVNDVNDMTIMRWSDEKNAYINLGGRHDFENSCMIIEIAEPGQYVLAVDNCPPAITQFVAVDNMLNPKISAVVSDFSGLEEFKFSIDDEILINDVVKSENYICSTGEFKYQTNNLLAGEHTATIYVKDTCGNDVEQEITFIVDSNVPEISNITVIPEVISEDLIISAKVSNAEIVLLNIEITDVYGNVEKISVDMIEEEGKYFAMLPKVLNGYSVNVWVSAYSETGNENKSDKQEAVVMKLSDNTPIIAITEIVGNSISLKCNGVDNYENIVAFLGVYDTDGRLLQIESMNLSEDITFDDVTAKGYFKVFVWNKQLSPISLPVEAEKQ